MQLKRLTALLVLALCQSCMHLPPQVRAELDCAAPDHFGNTDCQAAAR